jgi:signal peptidase I
VKDTQSPKYNLPWFELKYGNPEIGKIIRLPILSGSMSPEISPGDIISIECMPWRDCKTGEIIVFRDDKGLVAHRLLLRFRFPGKYYFYQKGDGNRFGGFIDADRVVGVVVESEDSTGKTKHFNNKDDTHKLRKLAFNNFKQDIIERVIYLPRILVPHRVKQIIKHFKGRK